jgi:hypothetical protein
MDFEKSGYKFSLIDDPLQKHVVAWEKALRSMRSEEPKEMLADVVKELASIRITDGSMDVLFSVLQRVANLISETLKLLQENETATLNSHRSMLVKAACKSNWFTAGEPDNVDELPSWVVQWMATEIAGLYNRTQVVPKV